MSDDRWTFLLIPDSESPVRQFSLSRRRVVWSVRLGATALLVSVIGAALVGFGGNARIEAFQLERQNQALRSELTKIQGQVASLETTLDDLAESGASMRGLAGLTEIDQEIFRVGIGGPGLKSATSDPSLQDDTDLGETVFAVSYDVDALRRRARLLSQSMEETTDSLESHRDLLEAMPSILPTTGWLSSTFSTRRLHPVHNRPLPHEGVDIAAPAGTPILAAASGRVVRSGWMSGYGQVIEIEHGHGYVTFYAHASKLLVRKGEMVSRGESIALVGSTGVATSSHLHYEVRVEGRPQNPMNFVPSRGCALSNRSDALSLPRQPQRPLDTPKEPVAARP